VIVTIIIDIIYKINYSRINVMGVKLWNPCNMVYQFNLFLSEFLYNNMKGSNKTVVIITVCYLYCKV